MTDEEQIKEIYKEYWEYMISKNEHGLREIMSDDYCLRHMTGVKQSLDEFLKGLMNGTFNYYSAEHDEIVVEIKGDTATMIGKSRVIAAVYGGERNSWRLRGDFTLRKDNGNWTLTSSKASTD